MAFFHNTYKKVDGKKIINKRVKSIVLNLAKEKDQCGFLKITIDQYLNETNFRVSSFVLDIFPDYSTFESFINGFSKTDYLNEYLEFYNKNKAVNYVYMEYKFEHLKFRE